GAYRAADDITDRPTVLFAYTVKGWGLPIAGDPLNHSALLTDPQIDELRATLDLDRDTEWDRFDPSSPEGRLCEEAAARLARPRPPSTVRVAVPEAVGVGGGTRPTSTQEAFGRILVGLSRFEEVAERLVTTSPDVAVS